MAAQITDEDRKRAQELLDQVGSWNDWSNKSQETMIAALVTTERERMLEKAAKWHVEQHNRRDDEALAAGRRGDYGEANKRQAMSQAHAAGAMHFAGLRTSPPESPAPTQEAKEEKA